MYFYPIKYTRTPYNNATPGSPRNPDVNALSALIPTHASSPFSCRYPFIRTNGDHSKNQPQHKIQRKLRSLFHKPSRPDFVDLYIFLPVTQIFVSYDGNNRRYFFSLPGYSLSGCIFLPVFLYTVTNSPAKAVRIPGISNVTTLSVREEHT